MDDLPKVIEDKLYTYGTLYHFNAILTGNIEKTAYAMAWYMYWAEIRDNMQGLLKGSEQ